VCGPNLGAAGVQPAAGAANSGALGALANFGSAGWQFSEKKTPPFNYIIAINYYIVNNVLYLVTIQLFTIKLLFTVTLGEKFKICLGIA
jgi:hypothetical protein